MRKIVLGSAAAVVILAAVLTVNRIGGEVAVAPSPSSSSATAFAPAPTTRDADFLKALGGQVTSVSAPVAEGMGHRVCSALAEGTSVAEIRGVLVQKGLTPAEATRVILAAVTMYCVENQDLVMGVTTGRDSGS